MPNKFKIIFFLLVLVLNVSSQAPDRFIQFYNPSPNYNAESYGVAETSYGYMLSGISIDTINSPAGYWAYTIIGVDFMGNQLFEKKYGSENMSFGSGNFSYDCLQKAGAIFYSVSPIYDYITSKWSSILITMNESGDTLWTKKYSGDLIDTVLIAQSVCKTKDNGFALTGRIHNGIQEKCFLLKTDLLGNQEWIKKYNHPANFEWGNSIIHDSLSKRYIIVGMKGYPQTSFVYIVDSLGDVIHQKFFSGTNGGYFSNVRQASNNTFIACGADKTGNSIGSFDLIRSFMVNFDINGNLLWQKKLGREGIANKLTALLIKNDTIIACGYNDTLYTQGLGLNSYYHFFNVTNSGDSVWCRNVDVFNIFGNLDVLKGASITTDGGIIATGYSTGIPSPTPFVLVKLDRWGCDTVDCQLVGINELNKNDFEFLVYPNPANDNLTISCSNNVNMEYYEVIDVSGKIIATEKISSTNFSINIQHIKQGIYALRLFDKNKNVSVKRFSVVH